LLGLPFDGENEKPMTITSPLAPEGGNRISLLRLARGTVRAAAICAVAAVMIACPGNHAEAATPGPSAQEPAVTPEQVEGTIHVCSTCHGFGGRSISPTFPRLAGQQKDYLAAQLKAFRDKTRADPHAKTYMWGMAAHLSDPMIAAIATYYSTQPPVVGEPGTSPEITAGAKIFAEGIASEKVLPCKACHGEKAAGNGPIPRLAGQHREYLARELKAFASSARANEIMHQNSIGLTPEQIGEVTAFLATQ
jgi:cytochrome c553